MSAETVETDFTRPTFKPAGRSEVGLGKGRCLRVEESTAPNGRPFVNVREWCYPDAYPVLTAEQRTGPLKARKGKGGKPPKPRMDRSAFVAKYGEDGRPDGFHGLRGLTASEAFELAEALVRHGMAVEQAEGEWQA